MSHGCDNCLKEGEWKRCSGCQQAFYCSKKCQTSHWKKHKANCFPPGSSIRQLFQACIDDLLPVRPTVGREYGFDNMRLYHGDVLWGESSPPFQLSAEQILLGVLRMIQTDVFLEEEVGARPCSSISPTMKMIVEAYENNSLDDFIHRFIRNVLGRYRSANPQFYCLGWVWNRLVIGPTRTEGLTQEQVQRMRKRIYHKYYGITSPANCCCAILKH